jgi:hypothetical protein
MPRAARVQGSLVISGHSAFAAQLAALSMAPLKTCAGRLGVRNFQGRRYYTYFLRVLQGFLFVTA